jgi:hypothetical protein
MNRTIKQLEENKRKTLLLNSLDYVQAMNSNENGNLQQNKGGKNKKKKKGGAGAVSKEQEEELIKKVEADHKNMEAAIEASK